MKDQFIRSSLLLGEENIKLLQDKKVAVFGVGGVGSFVCEALVRVGVGKFALIDNDDICITNINRQIHATHKTVGCEKAKTMAERMKEINENVKIDIYKKFILQENIDEVDFSDFDYIVDAVDTISAKIAIIEKANKTKTPIISAMGAGNKLDPTKLVVCDIYKTSVDPLAKVLRRELKKRDIKSLTVVYSTEKPIKPRSYLLGEKEGDVIDGRRKRMTPGSVSFVPSVSGLIIASVVVKDLLTNQS